MSIPAENLPVFSCKNQLLYALETFSTVILYGEPGSGKSTKIPQFLIDSGWQSIAVIQPRRIAAMTLAARIAQERGSQLGTDIGYSVMFDDFSSAVNTKVKFVTDGILLQELKDDPLLTSYSLIMVDDAHERSVETEILLGLLKIIQRRRNDLRIIISSSSPELSEFYSFFHSADRPVHVLQLPPNLYSVDIHYLERPVRDYLRGAAELVCDIHINHGPGNIIVFLPGKNEIDQVDGYISSLIGQGSTSKHGGRLDVITLHSRLPTRDQLKAFQPTKMQTRRCILATNIADMSVAFDQLVFVIDSGFSRMRFYDPATGSETLQICTISQFTAQQRAGRAGQVSPGICYRLYTKSCFENQLSPTCIPEIQRSNLSPQILMLKALGIGDILKFDLISRPSSDCIADALCTLCSLDALDSERCSLTYPIGNFLSQWPLEPRLGKILFISKSLGCLDEALTLCAILSGPGIYSSNPLENLPQRSKKDKLKDFWVKEGDFVTQINVYNAFISNKRSAQWCKHYFLNFSALQSTERMRLRLISLLKSTKFISGDKDIISCGDDVSLIQKSIFAGLFLNLAKLEKDGVSYKRISPKNSSLACKSPTFKIDISSVAFLQGIPWLVYYETRNTSTETLIRGITAIDPSWASEIAYISPSLLYHSSNL